MKRLLLVAAITSLLLTMASISWAATTINNSKSNNLRLVYDGMTSTQAAALGAELDKMPRVDEAAIRKALQKLFIPTNFKLIRIITPPSVPPASPNQLLRAPSVQPANALRAANPITVILLTDPTREPEARRIATGDVEWPSASGAVGTKSPPIK